MKLTACVFALSAGLFFCAAASAAVPALSGTSWMMELPKDSHCEVPPEIEFRKDGSIAGNAGCNDFKGNWKQDGEKISIGYQPVTNRSCGEAFLAPERAFTAGLKGAVQLKEDGKALLLISSSGKTLLRVVPAKAGACD